MTKANENANKFLSDFKNSLVKGVNVCKLGKVVRFYPETMKADVMPLPSEDNAMLINVPVATLKSSDFVIYYPLKAGDHVVLLFADNDTDNILLGEDSTSTERGHDVSDCVLIGGINLLNNSLNIADSSSLSIQNTNNSCSIVVSSAGEITLKGDIKIEGHATYNGREIAVKGDTTSDGASIV